MQLVIYRHRHLIIIIVIHQTPPNAENRKNYWDTFISPDLHRIVQAKGSEPSILGIALSKFS
jgi:hypothetical protein